VMLFLSCFSSLSLDTDWALLQEADGG
jgi:hypothetical protein